MIDRLGKKILVFDGAMGTMIQKSPLTFQGPPEVLNITQEETLKKIHQQYVEAGADIITTNTFGANRYKLSASEYTVEEVIKKAINNAKEVSQKNLVALDIGPIGKALQPVGDLTFDEAYEYFKEQVVATEDRPDLVLIETMSSLLEAKAAILAVKENSSLPVFVTMTLDQNQRTLMGSSPKVIAITLSALNVDAVGLNCSAGPDQLFEPIQELMKYTALPVMIQPNAGLPVIKNNKTVYDLTANAYRSSLKKIVSLGVSIIGGCCGTTPEFIKAIAEFKTYDIPSREVISETFTTSGSKCVQIGPRKVMIGERINPTGKPLLKEALLKNKNDYVLREALDQINAGAEILDVNVGLPEIDEKSKYRELIPAIQMVTSTPLQIDTSNIEALEAALRVYEGRPIINSVNGKEESLEKVLPLAKKYGALIVALTLDENGLPSGKEGRIAIAEKIINRSKAYGIEEEDILVDCITLSVSTHQKDALATLDAIQNLKKKYAVKTTLGASNISFGLPNRTLLNTTFLTMALLKGLDAPITDPTVVEIKNVFNAYNVLNGDDDNCSVYLNEIAPVQEEKETSEKSTRDLKSLVIEGLKDETILKTKELLGKVDPLDIIDNQLIKALDSVGEQYDNGELFLPQLIRSATCVKEAFRLIKKEFDYSKENSKGKIILATVEGDIHDIGKNIVKVLLENYGFEVIDLGKDVKKETIVQTIKEQEVELVGLSALMTTTVASMKETIDLIRKNRLNCKIFVGGAVLTEEYALMINADYYCKDAKASVRLAQQFYDK